MISSATAVASLAMLVWKKKEGGKADQPVYVPQSEQEALANAQPIDDIIDITAHDSDAAGPLDAIQKALLMLGEYATGSFDFDADKLPGGMFIQMRWPDTDYVRTSRCAPHALHHFPVEDSQPR